MQTIENNFEEIVLKNENIVLVDFYANWCGPCRIQTPILEKISESNDWFDVVKLDVDNNEKIAFDYAVQSIPTLIVFKNGEVVKRITGLTSEDELMKILNEHK